ncbi:MAG: Flp pilus assembly complex ATPase component TadA [Blastocatellia bacterium]|nr:Flp pilus assembly complex ATPase component TadA [Blastocatellia bacterium]
MISNLLATLTRENLKSNPRICVIIPKELAIERGILITGIDEREIRFAVRNDALYQSSVNWFTEELERNSVQEHLCRAARLTLPVVKKLRFSPKKAALVDILRGIENSYPKTTGTPTGQALEIRIVPEIAHVIPKEVSEKRQVLVERAAGVTFFAFYVDGMGRQWLDGQFHDTTTRQEFRRKLALAAGLSTDPTTINTLRLELNRLDKPDFDRVFELSYQNYHRHMDHSRQELLRDVREIQRESAALGMLPANTARTTSEPISRTLAFFYKLVALPYQQGCSDVKIWMDYVKSRGGGLIHSVRLDGVWIEDDPIPFTFENFMSILQHCKTLAGIHGVENHQPQQGRISFRIPEKGGTVLRFNGRVELYPLDQGVAPDGVQLVGITIRFHKQANQFYGLSDLTFLPQQFSLIESLTEAEEGMVLISGRTDSGKTTTLYALGNYLRAKYAGKYQHNLEDPLEFDQPGVFQTQIAHHKKMKAADYLDGMLRLAEDIYQVGELQDGEKAAAAVKIALSGHYTTGTIHAVGPFHVLKRLETWGVPPEDVGSVLLGVIHQKLVPKLCQECAVPANPVEVLDPRVNPHLRELLEFWKADIKAFQPKIATGMLGDKVCPACSFRGKPVGYKGRVAVFEVWDAAEMGHLIRSRRDFAKLQQKALKKGHITRLKAAMTFAAAGYIDVPSAKRVVQRVDPLSEGLKDYNYDIYDAQRRDIYEEAEELKARFAAARKAGSGSTVRPDDRSPFRQPEPPIIDIPAETPDEGMTH